MRYIKFKKELGWSEIIAFLALLISCIALWLSYSSNKSYFVYGSGIISATTIKIEKCQYVLSIPIEFHNSGKTAETFRRFVPSDITSVMFSQNRKLSELEEKDFQLYLLDTGVNFKNTTQWLTNSPKISLSSYQFTDKLISPNSTYKKQLILITTPYVNEKNIADSLYFSIIAEFGNGQKIPVSFVTNVEKFENTSCKSS